MDTKNGLCDPRQKEYATERGRGEPAIITVGAAVANAVFDACGARLYRMPLTPGRVLDALKKI